MVTQEDFVSDELVILTQSILVVTSGLLTGFLTVQKFAGRCSNEVIYVSAVTTINYGSKILAGYGLTWVKIEEGKEVPLGRYFSWLLTCPVMLMQWMKLHSSVGLRIKDEEERTIVILDQVMIVCATFGAISTGFLKWFCFLTGIFHAYFLFFKIVMITKFNLKNFVPKGRLPVVLMTMLMLSSWATFPLFWVLGPAGVRVVGKNVDMVAGTLGDLTSKNIFGFVAWYCRWNYAYVEKDIYGNILRDKINAKDTPDAEHGLSDIEVNNAKRRRKNVLVLSSRVTFIKTMMLMFENINADLISVFTVKDAKNRMAMYAVTHFDAIIVAPAMMKQRERDELKSFARYVSSPPYKVPVLGMYFDLDQPKEEPGCCLHGVVSKPFDESALQDVLLEWRLTAMLWKRLSESLEAMEARNEVDEPKTDPKLESQLESKWTNLKNATMKRKGGVTFGQKILPGKK
eukprot:snap_masked-scaffold_16-processed-gene-6.47-mRNA-1 protein AED:1.00 eAED:1.00 QI:0/0/0/0/1/1/3/0/457